MPSECTVQTSPSAGVLDSVFQEDPCDKWRENKDHLYFFVLCKPGLPGCGMAGLLAEPGCNMSQDLGLSMPCPWGTHDS